MRASTRLITALASLTLAACGLQGVRGQRSVTPAPPAVLDNAYEVAGDVDLPGQMALDIDGLHNVVFLGPQIISGAEPENERSFERLRRWGVRTILSVDGKVPDAASAERHGMRYVHVPINYKGLGQDHLTHITKTFRELEGPFYVHCYHGRHRGPAAAAIGRLVLDGIPREQAIAEMRQYCQTSPKYAGLYRDVASATIPSSELTDDSDFDFSPAHQFEGLRATMVEMARLADRLEAALDRGWAPDPEHPDVDVLQDATQLHQLLVASRDYSGGRPAEYDGWMQTAIDGSSELLRALSDCSQDAGAGPTPDREGLDSAQGWALRAEEAFLAMDASCSACHVAYRNE